MTKALRIAIGVATVMASAAPAVAASPPPPGAASCSGCHATGTTSASSVARLYGRDANEIMTAMTGFRDGSLPATVMNRIAKGFSDDELRAIAAWLAAQK
jgi:cytochrome subunit of sulfide dehydrogenase